MGNEVCRELLQSFLRPNKSCLQLQFCVHFIAGIILDWNDNDNVVSVIINFLFLQLVSIQSRLNWILCYFHIVFASFSAEISIMKVLPLFLFNLIFLELCVSFLLQFVAAIKLEYIASTFRLLKMMKQYQENQKCMNMKRRKMCMWNRNVTCT